MEESEIYNLLDYRFLLNWKEKIEKDEGDTWFFTNEKQELEKIKEFFNEDEQKLIFRYTLAMENKFEYLYYNLNIKILNFGVKIGMELQKAFLKDD